MATNVLTGFYGFGDIDVLAHASGFIFPVAEANRAAGFALQGVAESSVVAHADTYAGYAFTALELSSQAADFVASIWVHIKKIITIFSAVAYYTLGVGNLITGAFKLYWIHQKALFHKEIEFESSKAKGSTEKAKAIWKVFKSRMEVGEEKQAKIDITLTKFEKKGIEEQIKDLTKDYKEEINGWGDYLSDLTYRIKAKLYGIFNKAPREENCIAEHHNILKSELNAITEKVKLASTDGEKATLLKEAKRQHLTNKVQRVQMSALRNIVSGAFAHGLFTHKDSIDMDKASHQVHMLRLYKKVKGSYKGNKMANIASAVSSLVVGAGSIIMSATLAGFILNIAIGALNVYARMESILGYSVLVRYLAGARMEQNFDESVRDIFSRFDRSKIERLHYAKSKVA